MIRVLKVVVALAVLALASLVFSLAPSEEQRQAPVEIVVDIGQTGLGRNIEATVHSVRLAEVAETDEWSGETNGVWVIVDATASNVVSPRSLSAWLTVDGLTYEASTRPDQASLLSGALSPGIPTTGSFAFEVPRDIASSPHAVRISLGASRDVRLDSTVVIQLRLDELEIEPVVVIENPETGSP